MENNVITASRINTFLRCQRQHYWQNEIGLQKTESSSLAFWVGNAWHNAMQARWKDKATFDQALEAAIPKKSNIDEYSVSTVAGLLAAYYKRYGAIEKGVKILTEHKFSHSIVGSVKFHAEGKIDRLGQMKSGAISLVEYKTTSSSIAPDSDYWMRLRFNPQLLQYFSAARFMDFEVSEVIYDVVRKPSIRPKQIVVTKGKKKIKRLETPEEFYTRLIADCNARPDFYFARKEVAILEDDVAEFKNLRLSIIRQIENLRRLSTIFSSKPEQAWPRNVSELNCNSCQFKGFCLNNVSVNPNNPPDGYEIKPFNPELQDENTTT